jgi:hypothetical protein
MESRRKTDAIFLEMDPLLREVCSPSMLLRPLSSSSPVVPLVLLRAAARRSPYR